MEIVATAPLLGHNGAVYTVLARHTTHLCTAGSDGMIAEWQPQQSPDARLLATVNEVIFALAQIHHILVIGTMRGTLHFVDLDTKTELKSVLQHQKGVFDLYATPENLWSIGGDGGLTRWNTHTLMPIETVRLSSKSLRSFDFIENIVAVASSDNNIYIVNTLYNSTKVEKIIEKAHELSVFVVRFSPCGKYIWSGGRDAMLRIWDRADDFALYHVIPAHLATINDLRFSPDGKYVATASRDKTIKIWSAATFELLKVIDTLKGGHFNSVNRVLWYNNCTLCSVSDDRSVRLFTIS